MVAAPSRTLIWTYGLAFLGAHLAFMPLLVLLLPRRIEALAGGEAATILSWLLLTGAVVAGAANILAGALGDRWFDRFGNRRGLIAIGVGLLAGAYVGFALAADIASLFAALIYFQLALNCCFAPLGALLADHIANAHKGRMGGLMNAALPTSTLIVVPIAWVFPVDDPGVFLVVGALCVACMLPLLISWQFGPALAVEPQAGARAPAASFSIADASKAWAARFIIQTGAAFVIGYIYLYLSATRAGGSAWSGVNASEILAILTAPAAIVAILATLLGGYISDMKTARRVPTFVAAIVFGCGLGLLAIAPDPVILVLGYAFFQIGLAAFLSIDTALVAELIEGRKRRGLILGLMNLSNTLPAIIAPLIALLAFGTDAIAGALGVIFAVLGVAAGIAGGLVMLIRNVR